MSKKRQGKPVSMKELVKQIREELPKPKPKDKDKNVS